jgi:hypothetical protein
VRWLLGFGARRGTHDGSIGSDAAAAGRRRGWGREDPGLLTRAVDKVFRFVRLAEFEIFFVLFFLIAFILFKDLVSTSTLLDVFLPLTLQIHAQWDLVG